MTTLKYACPFFDVVNDGETARIGQIRRTNLSDETRRIFEQNIRIFEKLLLSKEEACFSAISLKNLTQEAWQPYLFCL